MGRRLISVGLDVGTTSTQMVVSELLVENRASAFSVPRMQITDRHVVYKSPVHFTPLMGENLVDAEKLRSMLEKEYAAAGIAPGTVDTGAAIITGETSRKENARAVVHALAEAAGDFVVATAGPHLESVLAAKGAGALEYSERTGKTVLHMDIGGGTSNLALICGGEIVKTACLNVGGRLVKFVNEKVSYISPAVEGLCPFQVGDIPEKAQVQKLAERLVAALEMVAGLRPVTQLLDKLWTKETGTAASPLCGGEAVISFSGGVADCIENRHPWHAFGDLGPALGEAIKRSALCSGDYRLGEETIRATVIGAGSHSTVLSGSTVFYRNVRFPLKNLPVTLAEEPVTPQSVQSAMQTLDCDGILFLPLSKDLNYAELCALADTLVSGLDGRPVYLATNRDVAKALGQALALRLPEDLPCLCVDGLELRRGDYLDVGAPLGPALPAIIKTLIFEK